MMTKVERIHDYGGTEVPCYEDTLTEPAVKSAKTAARGEYSSSKKENYHVKPMSV
jgi:hypothetical protein